VAVPPRAVWALRGDDAADPGLPAGTRRRAGTTGGTAEVLLVTGADLESRRRAVAQRWPDRGGLVGPVPQSATEWAAVVREATLGGLVVLLELEQPPSATTRDRITRTGHLTFVLSSDRELALDTLPDRPWSELRLDSGVAD